VLLMLGVALASGWWPARLASRLDPMQALRHD
jgi:ABC-type antimicrobial peptide transport system permease subunit